MVRTLPRHLRSLFHSLPWVRADDTHADNPRTDIGSQINDATSGQRLRLRDYFTLRPYGSMLMTPAVSAWLGSAWVIILLMASIEGFVWGAVGASLVPSASRWLAIPVASFMFVLMFSIVWIVDASLIMSERPSLRLRRRQASESGQIGPALRWFLGLLVRVAIVATSLYVTAPFIEKLIRADDIAGWHQARVEQYYKDRHAAIQAQIKARAEQLDSGLAARIASRQQEIARLSTSLRVELNRREAIEAEYAPEIEVLSRDLAEARARVGDEVLGRDGRPEGFGPEARKWDARAKQLQQQLSDIQAERDARLSDIQSVIAEQQQRLNQRSDALEQVRIEQSQQMARITDEVIAEQPPAAPPRLTFAARSKGLSALRNSPDEAGVPHFETVEGFAQAALGILFFALIALKLFEPTAVHVYFSDHVQSQYRKYLDGGLEDVPGFEHHDDPTRRLSPVDFYSLWELHERNPDAYSERIRAAQGAEARTRIFIAEQALELELSERRRETIEERLALERQHREAIEEEQRQQRRQALEDARQAARDQTRLRQTMVDDRRRLREAHLQQAARESERTQERSSRKLRIEQTRALLDDELRLKFRQRTDLSELHMRISWINSGMVQHQAEQSQLHRRLAEQRQHIERLRQEADQKASKVKPKGAWWPIDPALKALHEVQRRLRWIERERMRSLKQERALQASLARLQSQQQELLRDVAQCESEIAATDARICQYRSRIDNLLQRG